MSIQDRLDELTPSRLRDLVPTQPASKMLRTVYAAPEVYAFLTTRKAALEKPSGQAILMFDSFMNEDNTTFRMDPKSKTSTVWARNAPTSKGICDLRVLAPEPSIRIFGGFARADTFVALIWQRRRLLDFGLAVKRARSQWDLLFPGFDPITSEDVHAYISNNVTAF